MSTPVRSSMVVPLTHYRMIKVNGINVFYREAGAASAPAVLLPHGFPTSSHMFRNLIPALADSYRLIAPDYPGIRAERYARPEQVRLYLRPLRRTGRRSARSAQSYALRHVRYGLRGARRMAPCPEASRARDRAHCAERQRL